VTAVTNDTGAVVERYKYDAYGQVTFLSPTFTPLTGSAAYNNIPYTGRYFDTESKLYYYRARTYHPYLGRFLQRDPLGEAASLNLYNYVFNNPVNATDPTGMYQWTQAELDQQFAEETRSMSEKGEGSWRVEQAMPMQGMTTGEMQVVAEVKRAAKKLAKQQAQNADQAPGEAETLTIKINFYKSSDAWNSDDAKGIMSAMFQEAGRVFGKYGIKLTDGSGNTDPGKLSVQTVELSGPASVDAVAKLPNYSNDDHTVNVLFAKSVTGSKCEGGLACSDAGSNSIVIGENAPFEHGGREINDIATIRKVLGRTGVNQVLAHELGHQFLFPNIDEDPEANQHLSQAQYKGMYGGFLMRGQIFGSTAANLLPYQVQTLTRARGLP